MYFRKARPLLVFGKQQAILQQKAGNNDIQSDPLTVSVFPARTLSGYKVRHKVTPQSEHMTNKQLPRDPTGRPCDRVTWTEFFASEGQRALDNVSPLVKSEKKIAFFSVLFLGIFPVYFRKQPSF